jgi:murein DD-endopeptidase MepM/ murein hydrolase activator NlpD
VVHGFAPPPERWAAGHRGVDLLAAEAAPVRSAGPGTVSFAGPLAGRGVVVVSHADGTRTTYEPLVAAVARGDEVRAGETIGRLTAASGHCLPAACLHWGRRRGDVYLDPTLLLRAGPARLLPVWAASGAAIGAAASARSGGVVGRTALLAPEEPSPDLAWRLTGAGAAGLPLLAVVAAAAVRRRAHRRVGSSAASSA